MAEENARGKRRFRAPRGTADIFPDDMRLVHRLEGAARRLFALYRFEEVRTPTFEHTDLFVRGIGEATDIVEKEMFTFGDTEGGESFTLRPEGTASVVRAYVEKGLDRVGGFTRLFYIGPMFRRERPQAGRMREFYQIGAEALGSGEPMADAELIALAMGIFTAAGLDGCVLKLNSIGCPDCRASYRAVLKDLLSPKRAALCEDCRRRFERNVFRVLDCKNEACKAATAGLPPMREHLDAGCAAHFAQVTDLLDAAGVAYQIDDRLVRGFDYYTRTVWEVAHPSLGARDAVCGGGRYDGLIEEIGGAPNGASGFSIGEVPTLLALRNQAVGDGPTEAPDVYLVAIDDSCRREAFRLASRLRAEGIAVDLDCQARSPKAQFRAANRSGARFAGVIGPEELARGEVKVKDMQTGEETAVANDRLPNAVRQGGRGEARPN